MYALVKTGGKQYRVSKDDTILVERLSAVEGEQIILSDIVMLGDGDKVTIGTPRVDGAGVSATVMRQTPAGRAVSSLTSGWPGSQGGTSGQNSTVCWLGTSFRS